MSEATTVNQSAGGLRWLKAIGPGLIIACVVIGPGSILTSSKVGAADGYEKGWVVVLAVVCMLAFMTLGAKLGVVTQQSTADLVSRHAGRWLAVLIGLGVFFISAAFQFGNNLGVQSALATYVDAVGWPLSVVLLILLNVLSITFVFAFRNLYRVIEILMACFVGAMLLSFAVNLWFAGPNVVEFLSGLVPLTTIRRTFAGDTAVGLPLLGLVGTTFVITAAFYQSYLVRFKGWKEKDLRNGLIDARVGAIIMALITLMLMTTAAAALKGSELNSVSDVANGLQPLFGEKGRVIFCLGLFSAAFSSFLVNSMIGGFILSDALNLGSTPNDMAPRVFTVGVLTVGMCVALFVIATGVRPVGAIVAAQAVTVIASPLMAGTLLWLTNLESAMGKHRNGVAINVFAGLGLVLLILMSAYTAYRVVGALLAMMG